MCSKYEEYEGEWVHFVNLDAISILVPGFLDFALHFGTHTGLRFTAPFDALEVEKCVVALSLHLDFLVPHKSCDLCLTLAIWLKLTNNLSFLIRKTYSLTGFVQNQTPSMFDVDTKIAWKSADLSKSTASITMSRTKILNVSFHPRYFTLKSRMSKWNA